MNVRKYLKFVILLTLSISLFRLSGISRVTDSYMETVKEVITISENILEKADILNYYDLETNKPILSQDDRVEYYLIFALNIIDLENNDLDIEKLKRFEKYKQYHTDYMFNILGADISDTLLELSGIPKLKDKDSNDYFLDYKERVIYYLVYKQKILKEYNIPSQLITKFKKYKQLYKAFKKNKKADYINMLNDFLTIPDNLSSKKRKELIKQKRRILKEFIIPSLDKNISRKDLKLLKSYSFNGKINKEIIFKNFKLYNESESSSD